MDLTRFDQMLMEIIKERKTIVGFLETIFQFLGKCTDFYYELKNPKDPVGFPKGVIERIVIDILRKCKPKYLELDESEVKKEQHEPNISNVLDEEIVRSENIPISDSLEGMESLRICNNPTSDELFSSSEYFNGAAFENYCWSQTLTDIEIYVIVPDSIESAKQLQVDITSSAIKITDKFSSNTNILEGSFYNQCRSDSIMWSLLSNNKLQISLDKRKENFWRKLLTSEPDIDVTKIDTTRRMDELSEESQAMIEKVMYNQEQKLLGKPTTDELDRLNLLKQSWDVDGSPFKGQPFDPNLVNFQN